MDSPFKRPVRANAGLSLVELLVSVTVVGILAAIATPMYKRFTEKAKMAEGEAAVVEVRGLEQAYHSSTHSFSTDLSALGYSPTPPLKYYAVEVVVEDGKDGKASAFQAVAIPKVPDLEAWYLTMYADGSEELWHEPYALSANGSDSGSSSPAAASSAAASGDGASSGGGSGGTSVGESGGSSGGEASGGAGGSVAGSGGTGSGGGSAGGTVADISAPSAAPADSASDSPPPAKLKKIKKKQK
jgi:prepilin-type N-terminal cleavage/methylation domain-containing protein